jgi:hypothetical protein
MSFPEFRELFFCPKCRQMGTIFFLKISGQKVIIKQKCPKHGTRLFKLPIVALEHVMDLIRSGTFRCMRCGQEAVGTWMKMDGPWTLHKCTCSVHGRQALQRIWNTVFNQISTKTVPLPTVQNIVPKLQVEKNFCYECGSKIEKGAKICSFCGRELD